MKKFSILALILLIALPLSAQVALPSRYHTYDEIKAELDSLQLMYPDLVFVDSIGVSKTDSIPIWAVKLSDNASVDEDEPAVLYVGQCHAEEVLGVEISMYMINEILGHFYQTPYAIWLSELEIWFIPSINPEGLQVVMDGWDTAFRKTKRDNNLNGIFDFQPGPGHDIDGVDPNRNYSYNWVHGDTLYEPSGEERYDYYRGPEPFSEGGTEALTRLAKEQQFLYSINWHSSRTGNFSEKVFYSWEWDGFKQSPDFEFNKIIGETVASLIETEDGTGHYEPSPSRGRKGNAQDWFYNTFGAVQLLIECGTENLQPNAALVDDTCERCKLGAYWLMNRVLGYQTDAAMLTGHIEDAQTCMPIQAEIYVNDHDIMSFTPRISDELYGRYWRLLEPGTYSVTYRKKGYQDTTVANITINNSTSAVKEISLQPLQQISVTGNVHYNGTPMQCDVILSDGYFADTLSVSGSFNFNYYVGNYQTTFITPGYVPQIMEVTVENGMVALDINLQPEVVIFEEDWESGMDDWNAQNYWCQYPESYEGNYALRDNSERFYRNGFESIIKTSSSINLNGVNEDIVLTFWHKFHIEWEYDSCYVEISTNNQDWEVLAVFTGVKQAWQQVIIPLQEWEDTHSYLRFRIKTDSYLSDPGWLIDNITIISSQGNGIDDPPIQPEYILHQNKPNPFRFITFFPYEVKNPHNEKLTLSLFNIKGQLIRSYELDENISMVSWDGKNARGREVGSGIYFYQLKADKRVIQTKK
ncbi:MAG: M14 family zinc carboxypeptidase, partial [Candidatus Electryonea clarkiae]|nr:M14 family zinc carboxypeptidase [Candidatus Electryonea clarkiae]